jgi:hypothetical protein
MGDMIDIGQHREALGRFGAIEMRRKTHGDVE